MLEFWHGRRPRGVRAVQGRRRVGIGEEPHVTRAYTHEIEIRPRGRHRAHGEGVRCENGHQQGDCKVAAARVFEEAEGGKQNGEFAGIFVDGGLERHILFFERIINILVFRH